MIAKFSHFEDGHVGQSRKPDASPCPVTELNRRT